MIWNRFIILVIQNHLFIKGNRWCTKKISSAKDSPNENKETDEEKKDEFLPYRYFAHLYYSFVLLNKSVKYQLLLIYAFQHFVYLLLLESYWKIKHPKQVLGFMLSANGKTK